MMRSSASPAMLLPQRGGLLVLGIHGDQQLVLRQGEVAGQQRPGVLDRERLEVVAEAEIAQHLEEGVVAGGVADIVQVVVLAAGAHAFLRRGGPGVGPASPAPVNTFLNCTMPLLVNSSVGSLRGTSGEDWHRRVAVAGEEIEEGGADVVAAGHDGPRYRRPCGWTRGSRVSVARREGGWHDPGMGGAPDNLVLALLGSLQADVMEIRVEFKADLLEIKERLGFLEAQCASISRRVDRLAGDLDRVKLRLDLVDGTLP